MATTTTINTYLKGVKLITASTLSALETAINTYVSGLDGEYATRVDVDITTVRDVPEPKTLYIATVEVVGTTTTTTD